MLSVERSVLILLAAGRSERFGDVGSKLDQPFLGKPLGLHVAVALEAVPFLRRVAIVAHAHLAYAPYGFEEIANSQAAAGMATSVQLGIRRARELGAESAVIALADMPRVTAAHLHRLFDASEDAMSVVASSDGVAPRPPALFGAGQFDFLLSLSGDAGGRDLVAAGRHVVTTPAELIDVDTTEELEQLQALVHDPAAHTRLFRPS